MKQFLLVLASTFLLHGAILIHYVAAFGSEVSSLVCADETKIGQVPFEHVHVGFPKQGFDGQYYYALARNPWVAQSPEVVAEPAYRHARILYPALAWLLTGGDPVGLLWVLPAINLLSIVGVAGIGIRLARHYGRSAWWGGLLPLVLNLGMSSLRDLTDPLAAFALMGFLAAWILRQSVGSLFLWAIATALSREQNCLIILIVAFEAFRAKDSRRVVVCLGALFLLAGWVLILRGMYHDWPTAPGNLGLPFQGMFYRWTHLEGGAGKVSIAIHVMGMLVLMLQVLLSFLIIGWHVKSGATASLRPNPEGRRPSAFQKLQLPQLIALSGAGLAIMGGEGIFLNGWSYSRVFLWMPLGVWLACAETNRRWPVLALCAIMVWPASAIMQVWVKPP